MDNNINKLLRILRSDLTLPHNYNSIEDFFEDRYEGIIGTIFNTDKMKKYEKQQDKIIEEISLKTNNSFDIVNLIEKLEEIYNNKYSDYELLMYKYGVHDGVSIILEGKKEIK